MGAHDNRDEQTNGAAVFQLDLPPLSQIYDAPESLHALAAATRWLALGAIGFGLVGGVMLGA